MPQSPQVQQNVQTNDFFADFVSATVSFSLNEVPNTDKHNSSKEILQDLIADQGKRAFTFLMLHDILS